MRNRTRLAAVLGLLLFLNACATQSEVMSRSLAISGTQAAAEHTQTAQAAGLLPPTLTLRPNEPPPKETATQSPTPTRNYPLHFFETVTPYSPSPNPKGIICEDAGYVADVTFPDRSVMTRQQVFTKTWTIRNIGTCGWTGSYTLNFVYGSDLQGETTAIGHYVLPGQQTDISVVFVAPDQQGKFFSYWQLADDRGVGFGVRLLLSIDVANITATLTPKPRMSKTPSP